MTRPMASNARNGAAAGRGLVLVVIAVAIGVLLLLQVDDDDDVATAEVQTETETETVTATETETATDVVVVTDPESTDAEGDPEGAETEAPPPEPAPEAPPAAQTRVLVANGNTGVNGAAGTLTDRIASLGYLTATATNTNNPTQLTETTIRYQPGSAAAAQALAEALGWPVDDAVVQPMSEPPVDDLADAQLLVLLGTDEAVPPT